MKYYTFYRESNNFDDIIKDKVIKKYINATVFWKNYCQVGIDEFNATKVNIHITLKYGDELRNNLTPDFSPKPNIEYVPGNIK